MNPTVARETKVLIIDDQILAKGYMKYSLEALGFSNISYVDKAHLAMSRILSEHFDLIICSYNLKREQDGYYLYDQLKNENSLPPSTAFIFISADTTSDLVHSIVELQPDDFLAKPFTVKDLDKRLQRVLGQKRALAKVYKLMESGKYPKALSEIELFLTEPANNEFFPIALKHKGELLFACGLYPQAKEFYQAILNVQPFAWAQLGLINTLLRLNEDDEAEKLVVRLAFRPDSQLAAYDLLSALQIKQNDFESALESVVMATEISPRNIRRHKTAMNLSRINHDYAAQFEAAKKIVKFAKNSIHDKPENYLNVARSGIDFAMSSDPADTEKLLKQTNEYLRQSRSHFPKADIQDQLTVIEARTLYLKDEKERAKSLIQELKEGNWEGSSMEDLLDKSKAFHELGLYEKCQEVLEQIEQRCVNDQEQSELFLHYVQQEMQERAEIQNTPRELNNTAVAYTRAGKVQEALETFQQAFRVMPHNPSIALNLLQSIVQEEKHKSPSEHISKLIQRCLHSIENNRLNHEQEERYHKVRGILDDA